MSSISDEELIKFIKRCLQSFRFFMVGHTEAEIHDTKKSNEAGIKREVERDLQPALYLYSEFKNGAPINFSRFKFKSSDEFITYVAFLSKRHIWLATHDYRYFDALLSVLRFSRDNDYKLPEQLQNWLDDKAFGVISRPNKNTVCPKTVGKNIFLSKFIVLMLYVLINEFDKPPHRNYLKEYTGCGIDLISAALGNNRGSSYKNLQLHTPKNEDIKLKAKRSEYSFLLEIWMMDAQQIKGNSCDECGNVKMLL